MKISDAIKEIKAGAKAKFDETVEAHFNLNLDATQSDQQVRTTTTLPNGTGKEIKVAVLASKKIPTADLNLTEADISKLEKPNFDVLIVEPSFMPKLAKLGPILGPAGLMPNPKTGTVTADVATAVESFKKGKIELRTESTAPIIHTAIGKVSFDDKKLVENFEEIYSTLRSAKPQKAKPDWIKNCFLASSEFKLEIFFKVSRSSA